jgi:phosphinothricin acetyltransferase
MDVRPMLPADWTAVAAIYGEGIATGNATFETAVPPWDDWDRAHTEDCRLVAVRGGAVIGWAALSPVSRRHVYRGVGELKIYVAAAARGGGVGRRLLAELVACSERAGYWTLQAGVLPENAASLALHRAAGFREVGRRERIGATAAGVWRDVILLERRSAVVGLSDF